MGQESHRVAPAHPGVNAPAGSPPTHPHHPSQNGDTHALGVSLGPAVVEACGGRLSHIEWFRSVWQHGGAATGFARWRDGDGREREVLVKVPVGPTEHRWTEALSAAAEREDGLPTPRVLACGRSVGGYDLAWLVMERLEGHTLTHGWCRESLEDLLRAAALMQARTARLQPVVRPSEHPDWDRLIHRARELARGSAVPEAQHWNEVVKKVQKVLPRLAGKWATRPIDTWCHGDLHPGNAMRRRADGDGRAPCVLIDLALVHPGHWVEDAVYLERQFWGRPDQLFGIHPVSMLAKFRRELGLPTEGDYGALANLRRVLMAACAPVFLAHDGHPKYLHAALETLERLLPQVAH
jgi:aminoglycoside phosphotransferase (APT) family kinase protein